MTSMVFFILRQNPMWIILSRGLKLLSGRTYLGRLPCLMQRVNIGWKPLFHFGKAKRIIAFSMFRRTKFMDHWDQWDYLQNPPLMLRTVHTLRQRHQAICLYEVIFIPMALTL